MMNKVSPTTGQELERLRAQLQRVRAAIARLHDRSLDGVDSLLSVVQAELDRVMKQRGEH
jgi:hypothetical protein